MHKRQKIGTRPAYFDGQLLQAEDFIAEQQYHRKARRRHTLAVYGWGVVSGLDVKATSDRAIAVQPGFAVDADGNEIELGQAVSFDVGEFPPQVRLRVTLAYQDDTEPEREHRNRIDSHATLTVSDGPDDKSALLIATLQLDASGKIDRASIETSAVRRLKSKITPGSVEPASLAPALRVGWLRLPFHGSPLEQGPERDKVLPPPFLQGTTEVRSHEKWNGSDNTLGAGGNMAIPIPFGATLVSRFRLAGVDNADRIDFRLVRGGFDPAKKLHARHVLLEKTIKGHPYDETFPVDGGQLDPSDHTLALWVRGWGKTSISLVALEFHIGG